MKVLLVSHTCMSRTAGQPRLHALAALPGVALTALVPDRMFAYGRWQEAERPEAERPEAERPEGAAFRFEVGRTRWHRVLGQWHLQHYAGALARVLRETRPDVVDIWEEPWGLTCAQAVRLTRRLCPDARVVVETEQNIFKRLPPPFRQFQDYSLRHADFLVARSREAAAVARRKGYAGPARVVPNAVDCGLFRPLPAAERGDARAALGWGAPGAFVAGYVGRLVPEKGLADAVAALARLPADVHLALVGDGPLRPALQAQAGALRVAGRTHFLSGRPLAELPRVMGALDVLLLPSRTTASWKEQFGRVLIEAGACGVPVVGSDSGAIPEVVADAGLVFPEGDVAALAGALGRLRAEPAARLRLGGNGRARADGLFSWACVAAQMHAVFQETLTLGGGERGGRPRSACESV